MSVVEKIKDRNNEILHYLNTNFISDYSTSIAYLSFAFVFMLFGIQKPLPTISPVYEPLSLIASQVGLPTDPWVNFVGIYEVTMGVLFLFKRIRTAFWMFIPHQIITLGVLAMIPFYAFQEPWLGFQGVKIPYILGAFGAFALKNVVFIGGFLLLLEKELNGDNQSSPS